MKIPPICVKTPKIKTANPQNTYPEWMHSFSFKIPERNPDYPIMQAYKKIISSLDIISQKEIKKIARRYGEDEEIALYAMKKLTTFANYKRINQALHVNFPQADTDIVCLNSFINYMDKKNPFILDWDKSDLILKSQISQHSIKLTRMLSDFFHPDQSKVKHFVTPYSVVTRIAEPKNSFAFVDNSLLNYFESLHKKDPENFKHYLKDNKLKMIILDGFEEGINVFNQNESLAKKTDKIIKRAKELLVDENYPEITDLKKGIDYAANEKVIERLNKLGITSYKIQKQRSFSLAGIYKTISDNLRPTFPKYPEFRKAIKENITQKNLIEKFAKYLEANANIYSPRTLARAIKSLHCDIQAQCLCKPEEILYFVPNIKKSYGALAHQFGVINKIPAKQFIYELKPEHKNRCIVIIDDMLVTGQSTRDRYDDVKRKLPESRVVAAHIINDEVGFRYVKEKMAKTGDILVEPSDSEFLSELNSSPKLKEILGNGEQAYKTCISMPYMAPDTNNDFFRMFLEKLFLAS